MSATVDPLHRDGLLCVEASAGTGKTHLLSTLATRWLLERPDVTVANLLVVTFTVAAAAELRGRFRTHLARAAQRLGADGEPGDDPYLEGLAASAERTVHAARAARALAEFDTAMVRTIHSFATSALELEGGAGAPGDDLRREVVTDVLSARAFDADSPLWTLRNVGAASIDEVRALRLDHPDVVAAPLDGTPDDPAVAHRATVDEALGLFESRQRAAGVHTYADLLTRLDDELSDDESRVLRTLRSRLPMLPSLGEPRSSSWKKRSGKMWV